MELKQNEEVIYYTPRSVWVRYKTAGLLKCINGVAECSNVPLQSYIIHHILSQFNEYLPFFGLNVCNQRFGEKVGDFHLL